MLGLGWASMNKEWRRWWMAGIDIGKFWLGGDGFSRVQETPKYGRSPFIGVIWGVIWEPIQLSGIQSVHQGLNLINLMNQMWSNSTIQDPISSSGIWLWGSYLIFQSDHLDSYTISPDQSYHLDSCPISPDPISPDPIQSSGILSHQRKSSWAIQVLTGA